MGDHDKTKEQLLEEIAVLRGRLARGSTQEHNIRDDTPRIPADGWLRLFHSAVENANDIVIITEAGPDEDPGSRIVYVNRAFTEMTGYLREEAIGRSPNFLQGSETDPSELARLRRAIVRREPAVVELLYYRKDGAKRWVEVRVAPLRNDEGVVTHFVTIRHDVTERRQAQEALEASRQQLATAQRLARVGSWEWDIRADRVTWSEELLQQRALPQDFFCNLEGFFALLHPDDRERVRAIVAGALRGHQPFTYDLRFQRPEGGVWHAHARGTVMLDEAGNAVRMLGTSQDITDRKEAELALQRSAVSLRKSQAIAHLGSYESNVPHSQADSWSEETYRILGLEPGSPTRSIDDCLRSIVHHEDQELAREKVSAAIDLGQPFDFECRITRPDCTVRLIRTTGEPIRDAEGRVVKLIGTLLDVTERHQLEQQLFQAQKMEAVGRLAGGVAHDFNNMLTVITGFSELLLIDMPPENSMHSMLSEIHTAGERAAGLTRQLLAFSRRTVLNPVVLDLNQLVLDLKKILHRLIGEDIELEVRLEPELGQVKADAAQIEQVLLNLVVNARDAMPGGGRITLETGNVELDESYTRERIGLRPGPYCMLAVTDTGQGMNAQTMAHIFEPFFTTKAVGKGTGLGLAVVFGIIKQSEGNIEVYSEPGRGTAFKLYLPRIDSQGVKMSRAVESTPLPHGGETILLAEDEEGVRGLAKRVLESCGYKVLEAVDGQDALRVGLSRSTPIQLLVTDVVMPRMSGRDLAGQLQKEHPGLKVLFMSGYTTDTVIRHGALEEGSVFLEKPFTPSALARKVREILNAPPVPQPTLRAR